MAKAGGASAATEAIEIPDEVQKIFDEGDFTHAGLIIKALDSGRVLMTQRTPYHGDDEETYGTWEFPGGGLEPGEGPLSAALREFGEETGLFLPEHWKISGAMPKGNYVSILVCVPHESWTTSVELLPSETMGIGWFDPEHVENTPLTRREVDNTDWETVKEAALIGPFTLNPGTDRQNIVFDGERIGWIYRSPLDRLWYVRITGLYSGSERLYYKPSDIVVNGEATRRDALESLERWLGRNEIYVHFLRKQREADGFITEAIKVVGVVQLVTGNFGEKLSCGHQGRVLNPGAAEQVDMSLKLGATVLRQCSICTARTEDVAWSGPPQPAIEMAQDLLDEETAKQAAQIVIEGPDGQTAGYADFGDAHVDTVRSLMDGWEVEIRAGNAELSAAEILEQAGVPADFHDDMSDFMADVANGDGGASGSFPVAVIADEEPTTAVLHDEPEPALPISLGEKESVLGDGVDDPDRFPGSPLVPSSTDGRLGPDDPWTIDAGEEEDRSADAPFTPGDPRLSHLMESDPEADSADIASAAQAFLAKTALRDFSAYEQQALINEGEATMTGARNLTDRLDITGTHYELLEAEASSTDYGDDDWMG